MPRQLYHQYHVVGMKKMKPKTDNFFLSGGFSSSQWNCTKRIDDVEIEESYNEFEPILHEFDLVNTDGYFTPNMEVLNILRNPAVSRIGSLVPYKIRIKMYRKLREKDKKKPSMKEEDRKFLHDIFSDDVKKIEMLIGREFPWKNFH